VISVAIDANALAWGWGGIPRYISRISAVLAARDDMRVTLLTNADGPRIRLPGTTEVACRRRGGTLWRNDFVSGWLDRRRPDVFFAPETLSPWRVSVPAVVTVHDLGALVVPASKPLRERLAYHTSIPWSVRRAAVVLTPSDATARDVRGRWGVAPERLRAIPLGVDEAFTPGDREAALAIVRALGVREPYVLAVGALEPRKGLDVLIEAAALARAARKDWTLVLAGRPAFGGQAIAERAAAAGARVLEGVDEARLVALYRAAEVVAVPSRYEGFGLTALEGMACGTPVVVAGDSGALEEVSGPAALVVRPRTGRAWMDAIDVARSERARRAAAGLRHARGFSWAAAADRTAEALIEAAASGRMPVASSGSPVA
jgi:glycosyltransferase involved in cell wall biosynthesis